MEKMNFSLIYNQKQLFYYWAMTPKTIFGSIFVYIVSIFCRKSLRMWEKSSIFAAFLELLKYE